MSLRRPGLRAAESLLAILILCAGVLLPGGAARSAELPVAANPLYVTLNRPLVGCDPVGAQVPDATMQVLSLVLPTATVTTQRGTITQANSFLERAEVHGLAPLTVVFTIKKQATWSDGTPISKADFVATWKAGAAGMGPSYLQYRLIKSITGAEGSRDVTVVFSRPNSAWQSLFSPLLPARASEQVRTSCTSPTPLVDLSAGPYVIVESTEDHVTLTRNPGWWGTASIFDPVVISGGHTLASPPASGVPMLLSQDTWFDASTLSSATSNPGASSTLDLSNRLLSMDFATTGANKVNPELRLGLAGLLDRKAVAAATTDEVAPQVDPATSHLISQGLPNYPSAASVPELNQNSTTTTQLSPDPGASTTTTTVDPTKGFAAAEAHLVKAGYSKRSGQWTSMNGTPLRLAMGIPTDDRWAMQVAFALILQYGLQGVSVTAVPTRGSFEVAQGLQHSQWQVGLIARTTGAFPAQAAQWFTNGKGAPGSPLWSGFNDATTNSMALSASQQLNAQDALAQYEAIDARLWALMPSLPLLTEPLALVWSSNMDGVGPDPYPPGTLWWITTWKKMGQAAN